MLDGHQWITPDPLAEMRYNFSPYIYASNNPINRIDPDGMLDDKWWKKVFGKKSKEAVRLSSSNIDAALAAVETHETPLGPDDFESLIAKTDNTRVVTTPFPADIEMFKAAKSSPRVKPNIDTWLNSIKGDVKINPPKIYNPETDKSPFISGPYKSPLDNAGAKVRELDRSWEQNGAQFLIPFVNLIPPVAITDGIHTFATGTDMYGRPVNNQVWQGGYKIISGYFGWYNITSRGALMDITAPKVIDYVSPNPNKKP
jgi:hypothetical protein